AFASTRAVSDAPIQRGGSPVAKPDELAVFPAHARPPDGRMHAIQVLYSRRDCMRVLRRGAAVAMLGVLLAASSAGAQVQTGSITGTVTDSSSAVLPGVTVTLTGEKLIGGPATQVTDATGAYRFDRLAPGAYAVKFELQGFRSFVRDDIRINAAFI